MIKMILFYFLMFGCSFHMSESIEKEESKSVLEDYIDSDGDGLEDKLDPRPRVPETPFVFLRKIHNAKFEIHSAQKPSLVIYKRSPSEEIGPDKLAASLFNKEHPVFKKITGSAYEYLLNQKEVDENFGIDLLGANNMNISWSFGRYAHVKNVLSQYKDSDSLKARGEINFLIGMTYPREVASISDIIVRLDFLTPERKKVHRLKLNYHSQGNAKIELDEKSQSYLHPYLYKAEFDLPVSLLKDLFFKKGQVHIVVEDFHYQYSKKNIRYSSSFAKIRNKQAQVIVSNQKSFFNKFAAPGETLFSLLKRWGLEPEIDNRGYILSLDSQHSNLLLPFIPGELSQKELSLGRWVVLGSDQGLKTKLKAGQTYVVGLPYRRTTAGKHSQRNTDV